jgi:catechol 2,3-dioxygenase-like lactoylglutathione lyase family enzyme
MEKFMGSTRIPLEQIAVSSPSKFAHIVLRSADVQRSRAWYKKVLNAQDILDGDNPDGAGLTYDEEHHRVLILSLTPAEKEALAGMDTMAIYDERRKLPGLEHFAYTHSNLANLLSTYLRLKKDDIVPAFSVNHGGTLSFYYVDPDGNSVELLLDTMTMDQATELMHSQAFAENPVGYPVDPDDLCERYEAGESLTSLLSSPYHVALAAG